MYMQISAIYDVAKKWDMMANAVPHVANRLLAMGDCHFQGIVKLW